MTKRFRLQWIGGLCILLSLRLFWGAYAASMDWEARVGSAWTLSERASTLAMKSALMDQFVAAIDAAHLHGHDALLYPTAQNSVEQNVATLKSLQRRLHEIAAMDVTSFQYQQAISQITAQEQGEAGGMLDVIRGRWYLDKHWVYWHSIGIVVGIICVAVGIGMMLASIDP